MRTPIVRELPRALEGSTPDPFVGRMPSTCRPEDLDVGTLVRAIRAGDDRPWDELRRRFRPLLLRTARGFGLAPHDADEVEQNTWLRLLEHRASLRAPEALPGWLVTTARRESLRLLQRGARETPESLVTVAGEEPSAEDALLVEEVGRVLAAAVERLPERQRALLGAMLSDPSCSYQELAVKTGTPLGSVGPTLLRALARLRRDPQIARLDPSR